MKTLEELGNSIDEVRFIFRKAGFGKVEWHAEIQAKGEIDGYANSYSGQTWFVNNGKTIDEAFDGCFERASKYLVKE